MIIVVLLCVWATASENDRAAIMILELKLKGKMMRKIHVAELIDNIMDLGGYLVVFVMVMALPFGILALFINWLLEKQNAL